MTDGFILLDIETGKVLIRNGVFGKMTEVAVTPDGRFALSANEDNYALTSGILETVEVVKQMTGHNQELAD